MMRHVSQTSASHPRGQASAERIGRGDIAAENRNPKLEQDAMKAADDGDDFDEVPTVANRPNPAKAAAAAVATPVEKTPSIGVYRMVRPPTSDTLVAPAASKPQKSPRVAIGVARK
jgi:hypothetical protein